MNHLPTASWMPLTLLGAVLLGAVWHDVKTRRIPNLLVLAGTAAGLLFHAFAPSGVATFSSLADSFGIWASVGGFALGLLLLLPFYALGTLGAGDVKLMATVGSFMGPAAIFGAIVATMVAGGVLALVAATWHGRLRLLLNNLYMMAVVRSHRQSETSTDGASGSAGTLPYAIAIAAGTVIQLFRILH